MGAVNEAGVYEYDSTDGNIGPTLLNQQSAALTNMLRNETVQIRVAASKAARDALLAEFGAPMMVLRTDLLSAATSSLQFTHNGTTWYRVSGLTTTTA